MACSGGVHAEVTEAACTPSTAACSASTSGSSAVAEPRKASMPSRTGVELGVERLDAVFDNVHVAEDLDRRVERDAGGAVRRMVSSSSVMTDIIRPVGSAVITRFERSAVAIPGRPPDPRAVQSPMSERSISSLLGAFT